MAEKPTYEELEKRIQELEQAVSERKRVEEDLEKRIVSLTMPMNDAEGISFEDLFNQDEIQRLQDEFASATGVASIITHTDGTPITRPSNFCRLCNDIIRKTDKGLANCYKSDAMIGRLSDEGPTIQQCMSGGFWDAGAGISVGGRHIANWLIGQVRDETQTEEGMRTYAREIEADESKMIEAFREVASMSRDRFEQIAQMLFTLAKQLSTSAYQNVQQARFITEHKRAEEALCESEVKLRAIFNQTYEFMGLLSTEGRLLAANDTALAFGGLTEPDVLGKFFWETPWWTHDIQQQAILRNAINRAAEGELVRFEAYHPNKDGGIDFADFSVKPIEDESGAIIFLLPEGRDITDRKQAEDMLRKEKEFTEAALNSQLDTFFLFDATTRKAIRWNRAFNDITGYTDEEIAGMAAPESYYSPLDLERASIFIQGIMKTGTGTIELELICKSGRKVPTEYNVSVIHDEGGIPKYIISIGRDITERKQTEELLSENIHFFESLETINQAASSSMDPDQMLNNVVETVFKLFDCDRAWLLYPCDPNKPFFKVPIESTRSEYPGGKDLKLSIPMTPPMQGDMVDALTADGPITFGPGNQKPISADTQKQFGVLSQMFMSIHPKISNAWMFGIHQCSHARVWTDSERVLFNEIGRRIADGLSSLLFFRKLTKSEEKYRLLAENVSDVIWTMDMDLNYTYISPAIEKIQGWSVEEAASLTMNDILTSQSIEIILKRMEAHMNDGAKTGDYNISDRFELELYRKDGTTIWAEILASSMLGENGKPVGILGVTREITERKKLESQLLHVQKMEAIGTLAGGVAHDFNNLLMGIQGRASLISVDLEPSHSHSEHIHAIEGYIRSATDLTKQLLGFARGGKYEVKPTDVNELVQKSANMFGRMKKEIHIHTKLKNPPPVVAVDRNQIEQVLLNLYVNAWQAMPDGGELFLETQIVTLDDAYCQSYKAKPGSYAKVSVTDTGIGMDVSVRQRIFDPFFTTKEKGRGTGLGLASAYGIIKNHNGIITVYSEIGHGTTFNIYLPLSDKEAYREVPMEGRLIKGSETVLLVDDEKMILEVGQAMLEKLGYCVVVAVGGEQAVDVVKRKGNEIDLVILDLIMPGMDGGKAFDYIRQIQPQMPVMLSSGYAINELADEIMQRGCNGFLQKPFNISELSQEIKTVLDAAKSSVQD